MVKLNNHNSSIGFTTELTTNYRKEKVSSLKITFLYFIIANAFLLLANFVTYDTNINEELTDIPNIIAIGAEINQVILNLILNAAYAIEMKQDSNEGMITIRTYQKEEYVYCEIEDNGIGIKEELINRIYEPFFTTKPVGTGTGSCLVRLNIV
ncbi:MAG: sensor histidine kinase [Tepidibacillus sp.]